MTGPAVVAARPGLHGPHRSDRKRPLLRRGRLPHRSVAPGPPGADHACAQRPCPLRLGPLRLPSPDRAAASQAARRRRDRDGRVRRAACPRRRRDLVPSGRACAGLGADPGRASRRGLGCLGRLQARGRRGRGRVRTAAMRRLHHRIDVRSADLSLAAPGGERMPPSTAGGGTTPPRAARACSMPMPSARRSASSRMSTYRSGRSSATARSSRSMRCIGRRERPYRRRFSSAMSTVSAGSPAR